MPQNRDPSPLTREDRQTLHLIRASRRQHTAEARLKHAFAAVLLDLQAKLTLISKSSGER